MLVAEGDLIALKEWVVPKVENISDADAGVLADYVIALIGAEDTEDAVRTNCLEALPDFLHDHTEPFIDEVLAAIKTKSFLPKAKPSAASAPASAPTAPAAVRASALSAQAPAFSPPTGPASHKQSQARGITAPTGPSQSRKRRREDQQDAQGADFAPNGEPNRPSNKFARRGGRNGRGDSNMRAGGLPDFTAPQPAMPPFPMPSGFPALDPASFMPLLAMLGLTGGLPGMPPMPTMPLDGTGQTSGRKQRCNDYDTKGYCALGSTCPYEHGGEIVLPPSTDEYDPADAILALNSTTQGRRGSLQGRGRKDRTSGRAAGPRARAPFSQAGPNYDQARTAVVVEQIPQENFDEESVRQFFSQYGNITEIKLQAHKRLAIVSFVDYQSARRAYDSPKVIFDNRFVKVYWYSPEKQSHSSTNGQYAESNTFHKQDDDMLDPAEFERRQAEAQKAFEERQKKAPETAVRLSEIEVQMEDINRKLYENDEQKRLLREALAKHGILHTVRGGDNDDPNASLLDQLASLQKEAEDLSTFAPSSRGRGGYRGRGRGSSAPRGRGFAFQRGSSRGRGNFIGSPFAGTRVGVKRWDNRPRRIAVANIEAGSKKEESLREYLLSNLECDSIDPHPDRTDTQVITFKERYVAEMFLERSCEIQGVSTSDLSWVSNGIGKDPSTDISGSMAREPLNGNVEIKMEEAGLDDRAVLGGQGHDAEDSKHQANGGADFDVAEDEDQWL